MKKSGNKKKKMLIPKKSSQPAKKITALEVANYFLNQVDLDSGSDPLSNLKIQKLVYYAQGYHLAMFGKPLFDEEIEAWPHGPVIPSLYTEFKKYGAGPIEKPRILNNQLFSKEARDMLDKVFAYYDQFSAIKLRSMTHNEPTWENNYLPGRAYNPISKKDLTDYFKTQLV